MSKFERIVREPLVMGGQARIRDTGITVNEIVRLSLVGSSQAEILQQFPVLEAEDVHQALGFVIEHTSMMQVNSLQEIEPELASLKGWSGLLKTSQVEQSRAIETIQLIVSSLDYKSTYYKVRARMLYPWYEQRSSETIPLGLLEEEIQIFRSATADYIQLKLDANVQNMTINREFVPIMAFLTQQKRDAELSITDLDGKIILKIVVPNFELKDEPLVSSIELAASIIERNGSELKIRQEENSVIFEFALPIVES